MVYFRSFNLTLALARARRLTPRAWTMTGTKRKAPIRKTTFQAFIATYLVTCATLEADTTTPREAVFKRGEELLSEVVFEAAAYTERNNMRFSPVNLPTGAWWGKYGLKAPFIIVLGHFETSSLNLLGVLLAARSKKKDGLRCGRSSDAPSSSLRATTTTRDGALPVARALLSHVIRLSVAR